MPITKVKKPKAFQQELLDVILCREAQDFVANEQSYINEPEDYIAMFKDTLNKAVTPCPTTRIA